MFENKGSNIPGYTGHQRGQETVDQAPAKAVGQKQIPGYSGYIPGVGPENVYAKTYSRATQDSSSGTIPRGIDQDASLKYQTSSGNEFIHHNADRHESVSQTVGVQRGADTYKKPVNPGTVAAFFGVADNQNAQLVQEQQMAKNTAAFYAGLCDEAPERGPAAQSQAAAADVFWGNEAKPQGMKNQGTIPGLSTFRPRVEADCIFACTFKYGEDLSAVSQQRIGDEKADTLKQAQKWMPYEAARQARGGR